MAALQPEHITILNFLFIVYEARYQESSKQKFNKTIILLYLQDTTYYI